MSKECVSLDRSYRSMHVNTIRRYPLPQTRHVNDS
jgi:hypothetical protein